MRNKNSHYTKYGEEKIVFATKMAAAKQAVKLVDANGEHHGGVYLCEQGDHYHIGGGEVAFQEMVVKAQAEMAARRSAARKAQFAHVIV